MATAPRRSASLEPAPPRRRRPRVRGTLTPQAEPTPLERWCAHLDATPTAVQRAVAECFEDGAPLLVTAPTGSGKTAAVMLPVLAALARVRPRATGLVGALYVAPVRALSAVQLRAVTSMIEALGLRLRVAVRTGDTPSRMRSALRRSPPDVLLTTPESLAVMLAGDDKAMLGGLRFVVLDELHLLAEGKRGALLAATLATLDAWHALQGVEAPRRLAMTATARPLADLAAWVHPATACIDVGASVAARVRITDPPVDEAFPDGSWTWRRVLPRIARQVADGDGATLLFAGSRVRAEAWAVALRDVLPARVGVGCFHGSMSAESRAATSEGLRTGALQVVVATSALEAGVDLPAVRRVLVLGAPSSVTRMLQAAGRADHRPGGDACAELVPTSALDVVRCAAAVRAARAGALEATALREGDLDVAMQAALGRVQLAPATTSEIASTLRAAPSLRGLDDDDVAAVLGYLDHGGDAFAAYPELARIRDDDGRWVLSGRRSERNYRTAIGTLVGEVSVEVRAGARVVGQLDGRFAAALEVGDRLVLAGRRWRVVGRSADFLSVRADRGADRTLPAWSGSRPAQSAEVARAVEDVWSDLAEAVSASHVATVLEVHPSTAAAVFELVAAQRRRSTVPGRGRFVLELHRDGARAHLVAFTFAGSSANEIIARSVAQRLRDATGSTVQVAAVDECICITGTAALADARLDDLRRWLAPDGLRRDALAGLRDGVLSGAYFREVARVAQLWRPDARRGAATPGLLHDVLRRHDPGHVLLRALDHTLWTTLDGPRAAASLADHATRRWELRVLDAPSPLSVPVRTWMDRDAVRGDDPERALVDAARRLYLATLELP